MSNFDTTITPAFERHYPTSFNQCEHAKTTNIVLQNLLKNLDLEQGLPNIMLYGPEGSGKYTRAMITLCDFFGKQSLRNGSVKAVDPDTGRFTDIPGRGNTKKSKKAVYVISTQIHCEIDINQSNAERSLIRFLNYYSRTKNAFLECHRYIILRHADRLSRKTQNALRKVSETSSNTIRFIFTCKYKSGLITPLLSRFLCLPVEAPRERDAIKILKDIAKKENWKLTNPRIDKILKFSKYGTIGHIHLTEMLMVAEGSFMLSLGKRSFKIYMPDRLKATYLLLKEMKDGNRERIREVLQNIAVAMADSFTVIITGDLYRELLSCSEKKNDIVRITAEWNHRLSDKTIFYPLLAAEAFIFSICDLLGW